MFQRRNKRNWLQNAKESLWPTAGWLRALTYWGHRIIRMEGTPYSIAAGLACGAAVSMTPFLGLHFVLAALIAWAIGANALAGLIGTFIGNPWTFPFIWLMIYRVGCLILGIEPGTHPDFAGTADGFFSNPFNAVMPTLGPMMVGAVPVALATWWIVYIPVRRIVEIRQQHRRERLATARLRGKRT